MKTTHLMSTILLLITNVAIAFFPSQIALANQAKNESRKSSINGDLSKIPLEDVKRFTQAISQIKSFYVKDTTDSKLFEDAIRGMLKGLDPHSAYLDKEDFADLKTTTKGSFGGLGIEVTTEDEYVKVVSPIDDTPAYKAGVKAGDFIIKLDDKSVYGMKLKDAVKLMRGKTGTYITLTILRKNAPKPLIMKIKRAIIKIQSVKSELFENKYGYIRISNFQEKTAAQFTKEINKLNKQSKNLLSGLSLDLRNNPGGLLNSAIAISDALIHNDQKGKEELIVYTKGRIPGTNFTAIATPGDILKGEPIVVLINNGSASASEIVAGALHDNNRAVLVGTTSFGKGSVQTVIPLDEERGMKLTTSLYYTPNGTSIQASGLKPDIEIKDLALLKNKNVAPLLTNNEASLRGHIKSQQQKVNDKKDGTKSKLLDNDYQLTTALNMLKAMKVASKL